MGQEVTLSGFVHQSPDIRRAHLGATTSLLRDGVGDSTKGGVRYGRTGISYVF